MESGGDDLQTAVRAKIQPILEAIDNKVRVLFEPSDIKILGTKTKVAQASANHYTHEKNTPLMKHLMLWSLNQPLKR